MGQCFHSWFPSFWQSPHYLSVCHHLIDIFHSYWSILATKNGIKLDINTHAIQFSLWLFYIKDHKNGECLFWLISVINMVFWHTLVSIMLYQLRMRSGLVLSSHWNFWLWFKYHKKEFAIFNATRRNPGYIKQCQILSKFYY